MEPVHHKHNSDTVTDNGQIRYAERSVLKRGVIINSEKKILLPGYSIVHEE